jgi:serine phosphatase RsbU (regulator of sigma subunit)
MGTGLEEMAPHLNTQLCESLAPEQFVTLFVGELDHETGKLRYFNAGHEPPLIRRAATGEVEDLDSTGRPIALLPWGEFGVDETVIEPGDVFAVFSDGIPEATSDGEDFFGIEPVIGFMKDLGLGPLSGIREAILDGIEKMLGKAQASDDVTLMLVRRKA